MQNFIQIGLGVSVLRNAQKVKIYHFQVFIATHQDYGLRYKFLFWHKLETNHTFGGVMFIIVPLQHAVLQLSSGLSSLDAGLLDRLPLCRLMAQEHRSRTAGILIWHTAGA